MTLLARLAMKVSRHSGLALAEMAKKRRAEWPDLATAKKAYSGRGAFATWRDGYLDAYLQGGLLAEENSDMLHLACAPLLGSGQFQRAAN